MLRARACCRLLLVAGLVFGPYGTAAAQAASGGAGQAESEVRSAEEKDRQAMLAGDTAALGQIWSSQLLVSVPKGAIRPGAEVLALVKAGTLKYSAFERKIERIAVHGDVAVVMGAETVTRAAGADAGKPVQRRFTDVFIRDGGQWRLFARQIALVS